MTGLKRNVRDFYALWNNFSCKNELGTFDSFCLQVGPKLFYGSGHGTNSNLVLWTKRLGTWKHHGQLNTCGVHNVVDGESCGAQNSQATRESLREWGPAHDIWEHRPGIVGNSSALMETAQ